MVQVSTSQATPRPPTPTPAPPNSNSAKGRKPFWHATRITLSCVALSMKRDAADEKNWPNSDQLTYPRLPFMDICQIPNSCPNFHVQLASGAVHSIGAQARRAGEKFEFLTTKLHASEHSPCEKRYYQRLATGPPYGFPCPMSRAMR